MQRYLRHLELLRSAPEDLRDHFRTVVRRKVDKDRAVALYGKLYEAPVGLIGNTVSLRYHEADPSRIEGVLRRSLLRLPESVEPPRQQPRAPRQRP